MENELAGPHFSSSKSSTRWTRKPLPAMELAGPEDCPILGVVPSRAWPIWLAGGIGGVLILLMAVTGANGATALPEAMRPLWALPEARLASWIGQAVSLLTVQAALIVLWARSRSLSDFQGSYAVWRWTALAAFVLGFCQGTGAHRVWAAAVSALIDGARAIDPLAWWLAPAVLLGNWLFFRLHQEMRESRAARVCLMAAFLALLVGSMLQIAPIWERAPSAAGYLDVARALAGGLGRLALFLAIAHHARHVLYKSAEPPVEAPRNAGPAGARGQKPAAPRSWWMRWLGTTPEVPAKRSRRKKESDAKPKRRKKPARPGRTRDEDEEAAADEPADDAGLDEDRNTPGDADETGDEGGAEPAGDEWEETGEETDDASEAEELPAARGGASPRPAAAAPVRRIDPAPVRSAQQDDDDEEDSDNASSGGPGAGDVSFKGLSKRERRRLRQQMKEAERHAKK